MTEDQAAKVLRAAKGQRPLRSHPCRHRERQARRGTKPQEKAKITAVSGELKEATCRSCRTQLGLDGTSDYRPWQGTNWFSATDRMLKLVASHQSAPRSAGGDLLAATLGRGLHKAVRAM
jgi:hypothetical protein